MTNPLLAMLVRPFKQREIAKRLEIRSSTGIRDEGFVTIGGIPQWVSIRGCDRRNPVLLFVHGGPGSSYVPFSSWLVEWQESFTIVQWDQRGSGRTYLRNGDDSLRDLSLEQLAGEGLELTKHLRQRLNHPTIVLLGSSVGSLVGLMMVRHSPDLFGAYVGANQNSPAPGHTWSAVLQAAQQANKRKWIAKLSEMGPDPDQWSVEQYDNLNRWAVDAMPHAPHMIYDLMLPALLWSPDYSLRDLNRLERGMRLTLQALYPELQRFDFSSIGDVFQVPLFFVLGDQDILTPAGPARRYLDSLKAPLKSFDTLSGAHLIEFARPSEFLALLRKHVLPIIHSEVHA